MKISEANALPIAMYGAFAYWILGLLSLIHDVATGDLYSKGSWISGFVIMSATCGTAFYCILGPLVWRSLRAAGFPRTIGGITKLAWACSPLPPIAIALGLLIYVIVRNG